MAFADAIIHGAWGVAEARQGVFRTKNGKEVKSNEKMAIGIHTH
jgi:hypothetical protein